MMIRTLELSDFRNYRTLSLSLDPGTNIFYGDNAQGKTNILEAIYLSCTTKSHKGARDKEMIRFGQKEAHIRASVDRDGFIMRVDMHLRASKAKGVAIDGLRMKRAADFLQKLSARLILFSPEDLALIKGSPAGRRHFLDMELCQMDTAYMDALSRYQKTLAQRATTLKEARESGTIQEYEPLLDVYDKTLEESGRLIIRARRKFTEEIAESIENIHARLTKDTEQLSLWYAPDCPEQELKTRLKENRNKDLWTAQTNAGPHRDDLLFLVRGTGKGAEKTDVRRYGSQGQQRTVALSLKLAEIELVTKVQHIQPVMLLDDVLSELDENRQQQLLSTIGGIQTIITCTGLDDFVHARMPIDKIFHVDDALVTEKN